MQNNVGSNYGFIQATLALWSVVYQQGLGLEGVIVQV